VPPVLETGVVGDFGDDPRGGRKDASRSSVVKLGLGRSVHERRGEDVDAYEVGTRGASGECEAGSASSRIGLG